MRYFIFIFLIFSLENAFARDWNGQYLSLSGKNVLNIEFTDDETNYLSFEVRDVNKSEIKASFVASFENELATTQSLSDRSGDCILQLQKSQKGIFISDYCDGDNLTGYYQATEDFLLESLNILSLE